nr:hypothetical protein [Tanacetum cinerariifolium]
MGDLAQSLGMPPESLTRNTVKVVIIKSAILTMICYEFGAHGTSWSSILGDASEPATISLPLIGSDHGTILHQRDEGLQSGNNIDKETEPNTARSSSFELEMLDDREMNKSKVSAIQRPPTEKLHKNVAIDFEENHRLRGSLEAAELSITELKMELSLLQSHANEIGNETQKFSQELASESASEADINEIELTVYGKKYREIGSCLRSNGSMGVLLVEDQIRNLKEKVYAGSHEPDLSFFE